MNKRFKNVSAFLKQEDGSTSVLIVVMMIVLTAFGMAALTTAFAGYKLSNKNLEFSQEYYSLEGETSEIEFDLVNISLEAKEMALEESQDGLVGFEEAYIDLVYDALYEYAKTIEGMVVEGDGMFIEDGVASISYVITESNEHPKSIGVKLKLLMPKEESQEINEIVQIINKYEWQDGLGDVDDAPFFDDPFEEDGGNPFDSEDDNPFEEDIEDQEGEKDDNNPFILPDDNG